MSTEKKILPKIYPTSRDVTKTWFVSYVATDGLTKKVYGNLNKLPTLKERLAEANLLIANITDIFVAPPNKNQLIKDLSEVIELRKFGWSQKTNEAYFTHLTAFVKWYRFEGMPQMDVRVAIRFLNGISAKGGSATTRNNYRHNLKSLFGSLCVFFKEKYNDNPFAQSPKINESRVTKDWFKPAQVTQLIKYIGETNTQLLLSIKIMYHCFIRPNEMRQLLVKDINFETNRIKVDANIAKTKHTRFVPIPPTLLNDLQFLKNCQPTNFIFSLDGMPGPLCLGRDTLSKQHKVILKNLNYGNEYAYYGWKNTGAVKMMCMDKKNIRYISKCMGHHSLDMTDKYFQSLGVDEMGMDIIFPTL